MGGSLATCLVDSPFRREILEKLPARNGLQDIFSTQLQETANTRDAMPHLALVRSESYPKEARISLLRVGRVLKEMGPQLGKKLPGKRPRETAESWHTGPQTSRHVYKNGTASLSGAQECTRHQRLSAVRLHTFFAKGGYKLDYTR